MSINRALLTKGQRKILDSSSTPPSWLYTLAKQRQEQRARWTEPGANFRVGQKRIYLPTFTIAFVRTPSLPPNLAAFLVPLSFNKLDLRDYLWHAYNVKVHRVRSSIKQHPIRPVERGSIRDVPGRRKFYRPRAQKRMVVELDKPFIWPDPPEGEELEKFDQKMYHEMDKSEQRRIKNSQVEGTRQGLGDMRERARRLLMGKDRWRGSSGGPADKALLGRRVVDDSYEQKSGI